MLIAKLPMQENTSRKEKLKKWGRAGEEKENKKAGDVKTILIIIL